MFKRVTMAAMLLVIACLGLEARGGRGGVQQAGSQKTIAIKAGRLIDPETGLVVPRGSHGELCTRGYSVMLGYWNEPAKTAETIDAARWMHTGDLAVMDHAGYLNIVGRSKDMVIRGGENIYPREVEEFLFTHPAIVEVQAFGVPDRRYGEELCVWIRRREGVSLNEAEVIAFCRASIAHYKVPRYVRFVDSFPMTVTGKAQKYLMRKAMMEELVVAEERTA